MFAMPSTTWMACLAAAVFGLSAAGLVYLKIWKARNDEKRRKEATDAVALAILEVKEASKSGDPNRVRESRMRLQSSAALLQRYSNR